MNKKPTHIESLERRQLLTAAIAFAPHVDFVAGTAPVALVAADFNGDGNEDLAIADHATDKVSIFLGNGAGGFSAGPVLTLSAPPVSMITGDFNGDGKPDLAVGCSPGLNQSTTTVTVFLNAGSNSFGLGQITTIETDANANEPVGLAAADFNGDKNLDLAVTGYSAETISILLGNGTGTFAAPDNYQSDAHPTAITAADFNDDTFPDLAVTSTANQTDEGGNTTTSNQVSLLLDSSTGVFSAGPNITLASTGIPTSVAAANLTTATTPGLIVGSSNGTATLITNTDGEFAEAAIAPLAAGSTSVSAADFNLDGNTDLVSADGGTSAVNSANSVTVVPGLDAGSVAAGSSFSTGAEPTDVVVSDFNNDGKPDIATVNETGGTASVLLNTTVIPLVSTKTVLTVDNATTPAGSPVTLTATITASSVSPLIGEPLPTGTVNFYDGSTLLGSSTIAAGATQAVYATTGLSIGTHHLKAIYQADTAYAASTSASITETITPTATQGPDLVGTLVSTTFPATIAPGETGSVSIKVTNQGNTPATGSITNAVYLSLDNLIDSGDQQLTARGSLGHARVNLKPNQSITLTGTLTIPLSAPVASYLLLVQLNSTNSLAESTTANNLVVSPTSYAVSDVFGTVLGRAGITLQLADNDGNAGTFKLTGPGNGTVNIGDDGVDLVLDGTTAASVITITTRGSSFDLHNITADSAIGTLRGSAVNVSNNLSLPGGATSILLKSVGTAGTSGNSISLGAGAPTTIAINSISSENLSTSGGIKSLAVSNWDDGSITAGWIGTIKAKQNFGSAMTLSGAGAPAGIALNSATIGGTISTGSNAWNITGNIGRIAALGYAAGWNLTADQLTSISSTDDFASTINAASIASIQIRGSLVNAIINATGPIGSLKVTGGATHAYVASDVTENTLQPGGSITSISIGKPADSTSRFLAATLPKKVIIAGVAVDSTTDPRFMV